MHPQIEQYLEQVGQKLKSLSQAKHREELDEIRGHLLALVYEGQNRGLSEAAAVAAALRQFGPPERVGHDLNAESALRRLPPALRALVVLLLVRQIPHLTMVVSALYLKLTTGQQAGLMPASSPWSFTKSLTDAPAFFLIHGLLYDVAALVLIYGLLRRSAWAWTLGVALFSFQTLVTISNYFLSPIHPTQLNIPQWLNLSVAQVLHILFLVILLVNRNDYLRLARAKWRTQ